MARPRRRGSQVRPRARPSRPRALRRGDHRPDRRGGCTAHVQFLSKCVIGRERPDPGHAAKVRGRENARLIKTAAGWWKACAGPNCRPAPRIFRAAPPRRSPVARRRSPAARRRSPVARRRSPAARRHNPSARRRSPLARSSCPAAKRCCPVTRLEGPKSHCRQSDAGRVIDPTCRAWHSRAGRIPNPPTLRAGGLSPRTRDTRRWCCRSDRSRSGCSNRAGSAAGRDATATPSGWR